MTNTYKPTAHPVLSLQFSHKTDSSVLMQKDNIGRIGRVNNTKVELRWVVGGCNNDFHDRSDFVDHVNSA